MALVIFCFVKVMNNLASRTEKLLKKEEEAPGSTGYEDPARTACQKSRSRQPDVHTVHLSFRLRIRTKKNKEKTGIIRQRGT